MTINNSLVKQEVKLKRLYRNTADAKIAGICAGIADYFEIDPVIVRLIFLISIFWGGGILAYIVAWFIVPVKPE
ncbi:MAG: PspC domain-containing protein [Candidatus Marinimicrobia bacterium]|nr:PspC domain-containing protein [Candidatus Neomarinimicrobiota bacterium]